MSDHKELCESLGICINRKPGCACIDTEREAEIARLRNALTQSIEQVKSGREENERIRERVRVLELAEAEADSARRILTEDGERKAFRFPAYELAAVLPYRRARLLRTDAAKAMEQQA